MVQQFMGQQSENKTQANPHFPKQPLPAFDYYSCEEAVKRLNDYLDRELTEKEREDVIKHLQICRPCLEKFSFEENLIRKSDT